MSADPSGVTQASARRKKTPMTIEEARRLFRQGHYDDCAHLRRDGSLCNRYCYAMKADSILWGVGLMIDQTQVSEEARKEALTPNAVAAELVVWSWEKLHSGPRRGKAASLRRAHVMKLLTDELDRVSGERERQALERAAKDRYCAACEARAHEEHERRMGR